jgi:hypothetical protein
MCLLPSFHCFAVEVKAAAADDEGDSGFDVSDPATKTNFFASRDDMYPVASWESHIGRKIERLSVVVFWEVDEDKLAAFEKYCRDIINKTYADSDEEEDAEGTVSKKRKK